MSTTLYSSFCRVTLITATAQATWRPSPPELFPFGGPLDAAPAVSDSVSAAVIPIKVAGMFSLTPPAFVRKTMLTSKRKLQVAGGAYRPPHARGTLTPTLFKREDEGGAAYVSNGVNNFPNSGNGRTSPSFQSRNRRTIPGAAAAGDAVVDANDVNGQGRRKKKDGNQKKRGGDDSNHASGTSTPIPIEFVSPLPIPATAAEVALSEADKKRRALMKKLMAIDQLKVKRDNGTNLELTQIKKLDRFVFVILFPLSLSCVMRFADIVVG